MTRKSEKVAALEQCAAQATRFLISLRGVKGKDVHEYMRESGGYTSTLSGLFSNLLNLTRSWNIDHLTAICSFFDLEPDEFLRVGRILCNGVPPYPAPEELSGTKPGSRERFALLYERAAQGTWLPKVYDARAAAAWSPPAFTAYQKGKLGDDVMFAALADMVRRLETNPGLTPKEIASTFGLLRD